ncbi:MAG TPA: hypothetical protein VJ998_11785, partial [Pseudomonadales bacterium]|nr:hypothetical protein [Pseudomonadales bacterium]
MRREQIQLIALTLAPPLLVVLLSLTLLYRRPDTTDLWLAVTATVLVLAASIILYRKLWRNVFTPLEQLAQDVTAIEPGLPLHSQSSLMEQLVIAIEQRLSDLSSTRPSETESLAENALHLENTVGKNKPAHTGRDLNKHGMRTETLVAATEEPLSKIIACTNLLTASGAHQDLTRRLFAAAQGFTFLARELANVDYSSELPTSFDIRQVNDEVIASLGPLLSESQRILSFFDEFGPKRFIANRSLIGALLFNFFLDRLPRTAAALELEVGYLTEDSLVFRLAPSIGHQEPSIRFTELATALGATLGDDILSIPVNVDHAFRQPETRLTATIFSNDTRQLESLSSRLASMRVNVLGEDYNAHVCIATIDDVAAIELLRTRLAPQSHLLLLSNTRLMHLPNTRQLDNPLQHEALAQTLYELTDIEGSDTPMVLVVDGNAANSRLLSLHLNDLGVSVETAEDGATAI